MYLKKRKFTIALDFFKFTLKLGDHEVIKKYVKFNFIMKNKIYFF